MDKEWYLLEYENKTYLHNKVLIPKRYSDGFGGHAQCELCWARFSGSKDDLKNGYYEPASRSWICPECYSDFASLFGWSAEE